MLIDEVEPEKAVMVSHRGVAQPGQDVPRSRDGEKQEQSGEQMELAPAPPLPGDAQVGDQRHADDHQREQALGQHGQRKQRVDGVPFPARVRTIQRTYHAIECRALSEGLESPPESARA